MSDLSELMELRPLVSEYRHTIAQLRRDVEHYQEIIRAKEGIIVGLRASLVAIREAQNYTPPMGTPGKDTRALSKRWTEPK